MRYLTDNLAASPIAGSRKRPVRLPWLILLALATLQFAIAQHSSAHEIEELAETCQLCLKLDDQLPAAGDANAASASLYDRASDRTPSRRAFSDRYPRVGETRAPPVL